MIREAGTPHAAFHNPNSISADQPRESIEVRLLVLTKNIKDEVNGTSQERGTQ